jgi:hypothetical protein
LPCHRALACCVLSGKLANHLITFKPSAGPGGSTAKVKSEGQGQGQKSGEAGKPQAAEPTVNGHSTENRTSNIPAKAAPAKKGSGGSGLAAMWSKAPAKRKQEAAPKAAAATGPPPDSEAMLRAAAESVGVLLLLGVCVCVCVRERERERERKRGGRKGTWYGNSWGAETVE